MGMQNYAVEQGLESGNGVHNNFSASHPVAWYDNKQFSFSSSAPTSPVDVKDPLHHLESVREEDSISERSTKST
jgi:hypothetical protein